LVATIAAMAAPAKAAPEGPWRVMLLNDSDPTLPAYIAIDRSLRAA
jgi:hypothetical protein